MLTLRKKEENYIKNKDPITYLKKNSIKSLIKMKTITKSRITAIT